jgi:hypothetical protein
MARDTSGLRPPWKPGEHGGGRGRAKGYRKFRKLIREMSPEALAALRAALAEPGERVGAAKVVLEFSWGKAPTADVMARLDAEVSKKGKAVREDALEALSDAIADVESGESH